ncbi:RHS repeat-associated core domain-containing protein [Pseudomonas sp. 18173]|uniref:RHS repeat-associated core domain-containing protein n=1 Tax=Pseudomonas sp. 18173 TaxID=3390055 RepID=UPI003D248AFC
MRDFIAGRVQMNLSGRIKMAGNPIYSNALNFTDFLKGGVDPRTGLYTCSLSLGDIESAGLNGPTIAVNFFFNPLSDADNGFGAGWSMARTCYEVVDKTLTLSGGESFKAQERGTHLVFDELKLETVKVLRRDLAPTRYDVIHKSGLREELEIFPGSDLAVPMRLIAANGVAVTFEYAAINQRPVLKTIKDGQRTLLSITRTAGAVTLTKFPGTASEARFVLHLTNNVVQSVVLPEGGKWDLKYETIGGFRCLVRVESPQGAFEIINYRQNGHRLANGAPLEYVPYVTSHTLFPRQGQAPITRNYAFSSKNFLGHDDPNTRWSQDGDVLYRSDAGYEYSSTETLMSGEQVHTTTTRNYNKYHLLVREQTLCQGALVDRSTQYHLDPRKSFRDQPAQFRMPRTQTVRYEVLSTQEFREEVTHTEYDGTGNLLRSETPDGIVIESEYYPASGAQGCPADPLGFVRFEKQRVVTPGRDSGAAITITRFEYALLPGLEGFNVPNVVATRECLYEHEAPTGILHVQTDLAYCDYPEDALRHGLLKEKTVTCGTKATRTLMEYSIEGTTLTQKKTLVGFDDTRQTSSQTISTLTGNKLSSYDENEGTVVFEYDRLDRVIRETSASNTPWQASRITTYHLYDAVTRQPATIVSTDVNGIQQTTILDGLGRTIRIDEQDGDHDPDKPWRTVFSALHNAQGQLASQTTTDWLEGQPRELHSQFVFDRWGAITSTVYSDGREERRTFDPITRREESWQQGLGKTVTLFNAFGKPDSTETFDTAGQSLGKTAYAYDGLGRTVNQVDPVGNSTTYQYDVFGRLLRSVLPDGHSLETEYASHSIEALPVQVSIAGVSVGQQTFDGLGRLTSSQVGGRQTTWGYTDGLKWPAWELSASGQRTDFKYESDLNRAMIERRAGSISHEYAFDAKLGLPTTSLEQGRKTRECEYYPSGHVKTERLFSEQGDQTSSYIYSMAGRPLVYVDVFGNEHKTRYDKLGRPQSFECGAFKSDFVYNLLGQLVSTRVQGDTGRALTTHLTYDDIGRESSRRFEIEGQASQTLTSSYTPAGKLAKKTLSSASEVLREETFEYDRRGRLSDYHCRGRLRPQDPFGKEIIRQKFAFDAMDNILGLETEFPGGSNRMTYTYSSVDPTRLTGVHHTHPDYPKPAVLQYDADGRVILDDQARTLGYDELGRLVKVANADGSLIRGYQYDARDRLVEWTGSPGLSTHHYYRGRCVVNERSGEVRTTCLRQNDQLLGRRSSAQSMTVYSTDSQQNVLGETSNGQHVGFVYSPYGYRPAEGGLFSVLGFCGEQLDPATGLYLPGSGYRAYSPTLMRFLSPDSMSPFGAGGLNPYAYCGGDPINRVDPTGHFWQALLGIGLSIAGFALSVVTMGAATPLAIAGLMLAGTSAVLGIAGAIVDEVAPGSVAGEVLGWASLATGLASVGAGLAGVGKAAVKAGNKMAGAFKSGLTHNRQTATRAARHMRDGRASIASEASTKWTVKGPKPRNVSELRPAQMQEWEKFKSGLDAGLHPKIAAQRMGDSQFKRFAGTQQWQIRLGGADRVTFTIDDQRKLVEILQVGGHT